MKKKMGGQRKYSDNEIAITRNNSNTTRHAYRSIPFFKDCNRVLVSDNGGRITIRPWYSLENSSGVRVANSGQIGFVSDIPPGVYLIDDDESHEELIVIYYDSRKAD